MQCIRSDKAVLAASTVFVMQFVSERGNIITGLKLKVICLANCHRIMTCAKEISDR